MNIATNPWSFTSGDVATTPISNLVLGPGYMQQTVTLTTSAASFPASFVVNGYATIIGTTPAAFIGLYKILNFPSATSAVLQRINGQFIPPGTVYSSGGNLLFTQYVGMIRGEDMSWQDAASAGDEITVYNAVGYPVWDTVSPSSGNYSRGKPFWINGLAIQKISSGKLFLTVN